MKFTKELYAKLTAYFIDKLGVTPHKTGWLRQGVCPNCGKSDKFGVNLWINRTNCFSCQYHPSPVGLIVKLEGLATYNEVFSFLNAFEGAEYLETKMPILEEKPVQLPESFTLLAFGDDMLGRRARSYMKRRGYNINNLTMRGVGYCTTGPYAYRIIIPYYERGKLVYFNARSFITLGSKHKNPPVTDFGVGKAQLIFNVDALHLYSTCHLVESATNALTLGDRAFGTGGKIVSDYQLSKILRGKCININILLDPDAYWEALRVGLRIANHKKVRVVKLPNFYRGKDNPDVNDLGKKKTIELIKKSRFLTYREIYKEFINTPRPDNYLPEA